MQDILLINYVDLILKKVFYILTIAMLTACAVKPTDAVMQNELPSIFPDYTGVTIPSTIAPMDFNVVDDNGDVHNLYVEVKGSKGGTITGSGEATDFDIDDWHSITEKNKGGKLTFTVYADYDGEWRQYKDFEMMVSDTPLDEYGLTYRRIAPGYEVYSMMGLYQRDLSCFDEDEIIANTRVPGMCVNCHTQNRTNPDQMLFHVRGEYGATALQIDGKCEMLDTKTDSTLGFCVYPYWHPEGRYVAFSTNTTRQGFHTASTQKRIEVFDLESDLQVYDTKTHQLVLSPLVKDADRWETFPAFSADGKTLYFCSTSRPYTYPDEFDQTRYNLYSIGFDATDGTFAEKIDTIINAERDSVSITFPRPSYDGKYLMYTQSRYGTFPIWHKEADLWLLDLATGERRPLSEVNSSDTDSYHSWSSNSKWFVFSSRRVNGLYTALYISQMDKDGKATKPFMLPQRNPKRYYDATLYSYNVPDFTKSPVRFDARSAAQQIASDERRKIDVRK